MNDQDQPIPTPETPIQQSDNNWLKTLSIGLGVIGIGIAIGIGGYVLGTKKSQPVQTNSLSISPTAVQPNENSNETANWKTYINDQYNFQFKYPTDLDLRLNEGLKNKDVQLELHAYNPDDYFELTFLISTEPEGLLFEEKYGISESGLVSITFNDIVALKSSGYGGDGGWVYIEKAFFTHDDLTYYFSTGTADRKNLLNQILSTFKFTK